MYSSCGGNLLIRGGRVLDPASGRDEVTDVLIAEGRIAKIGNWEGGSLEGWEVIDAGGLLVVPGLIDMHVHLREPGREDEETIVSGSEAAAAGGFTAVACMPNTDPPLDDQGAIRFVLRRAEEAPGRVYPIGAITKGREGKELTEVADLVWAGAVAISDDGKPVLDSGLMRRALEYAKMFDIPVISHCEDLSLSRGGVMHEGRVSSLLGMKGMPSIAEEVMVSRDLALAGFTEGRLHIAHVSTAVSVALIREAKLKGVQVTAEATPHHFTLTDEAVRSFDTNTKMNPPLRTAEDVEAIKAGLADGTIDALATDHAPHSTEEKDVEFDAAPFGIVGLETALGLVWTELVEVGVLSPLEAVAKLTLNPACILGVEGGKLEVGALADVTVIDPNLEWEVDPENFRSKSCNTPFQGRRLKGKAVLTIVGGEIVFREGKDLSLQGI